MEAKMREVVAVLLLVLVGMVFVVACGPSSLEPQAQAKVTPQATPSEPKSPAALQTARAGELAPSYEEIETGLSLITHKTPPNGPEMGPDGVLDPTLRQEWGNYNDSLFGKRIEGWVGCLLWAQPSVIAGAGYLADVLVDESKLGPDAPDLAPLVELHQVPPQDMQSSAETLSGSTTKCQRVTFSGSFWSIDPGGGIIVANANIRPMR